MFFPYFPSFRPIAPCSHLEMQEKPKVNITNQNIANNLLKSVGQLLNAEVKHYTCSDKTTQHEKYVIEYNHSRKDT